MGNVKNEIMDFTADVGFEGEPKNGSNNGNNISANPVDKNESKKSRKQKERVSAGQNPLMTLNEFRPGLTWECSETGTTPATKKFCLKTTIDGETFEGFGVSKKLAKVSAAKSVLSKLYNMSFTIGVSEMSKDGASEGEMKVSAI